MFGLTVSEKVVLDYGRMNWKHVMNPLTERVLTYGRMIKFSHTVFALPFALSSAVLSTRYHKFEPADLIWILLAMVGARSASMGFNRITDAGLDVRNPRTCQREIPAGRISVMSSWILVILSSALFIFSAGMLGRICLIGSFPVLLILFGYSYTKRFTWLCHLYLGFAISLAPLGTWIALTQGFSWSIVLLSLALMTYIAGFDILYACQDLDVDRREGLFSIPVFFGVQNALLISSALHVLSFICFFLIHIVFDMHLVYLITVMIIGVLLIIEQRLVTPDDLSRVPIAFFHINSIISILLFVGILIDELLRRCL